MCSLNYNHFASFTVLSFFLFLWQCFSTWLSVRIGLHLLNYRKSYWVLDMCKEICCQSCSFSFFAQTWNWHNLVSNNVHKPLARHTQTHARRHTCVHKLQENNFLLKVAAEKLMNKQSSEQEQSTTKQINTRCQRNDIRELNHFRALQSGITIPT